MADSLHALPERHRGALLVFACGLVLVGCTQGPRPVIRGTDVCAQCRMTITDMQFASQLVTARGKQHPFDSIECLAWYLDQHPAEEGATLWVTDYASPETFIEAHGAVYVHGPDVMSPMAANLAAFSDLETARAAAIADTILTFEEALSVARNMDRSHPHHASH